MSSVSARTQNLFFHLLLPHDALVLGHGGHGAFSGALVRRLDAECGILKKWEVEELELVVERKVSHQLESATHLHLRALVVS